ncbi:MAG TPA: 50S ribosomal protein L9, partial [Casimicrobiaceae bacterium]|nr:50S ribosomal protein L9 [Casimicrobiaceae bacterium]
RRADLEKAAAEKLTAAEALAEKLEVATLRISQKSGVDGRLFGSVTNVDIVDALKKQGTDVEKAMVRMPSGPLKQVGDHPVTVALHTDVTAHITVHVVGETVGS